jgi:glycerol kinase
MFMSLKNLDWDAECLKFFGVKHSCLPKIVSNSEIYGKVSSGAFEGFPIAGMIGDQQAALVGNKVSKSFIYHSRWATDSLRLLSSVLKSVQPRTREFQMFVRFCGPRY